MKKRNLTHAAKMETKLLLSLLVLLLALTGCNAPNTPMDTTPEETPEVTPGETTEAMPEETTQGTPEETTQGTPEDTTVPVEDTTEETTAPEPIEAKYDIFKAMIAASYNDKQSISADTFASGVFNWYYSLDVEMENGQLVVEGILYECTYVEDLPFAYDPGLYRHMSEAERLVLDCIQRQSGYYILQHESIVKYGHKIAIVEMEDTLYFLAVYEGISGSDVPIVGRIHSVQIGRIGTGSLL